MIWFKDGVRIKRYSKAIHKILSVLNSIESVHDDDWPTEIFITSINDSQHGVGSKHYKDMAIDVRSKNFPSRQAKDRFVKFIADTLGENYTVLFENEGTDNEHYHIQVRKGLVIL